MSEKEELYAKKIVNGMAEENFSFREAINVTQKSYALIKKAARALNQKQIKAALKEGLKAAEDYSSSIGKSPKE